MSVITLIRHGQASFGQAHYDRLSDLGQRQASLLGPDLVERGLIPVRVFAGSMERQQHTAQLALAAAGLELEVETDPGWNEFDHEQVLQAFRPEFSSNTAIKAFAAQQQNPQRFLMEQTYQAFSRWQSGQHDHDYHEPWQQFSVRVGAALARAEQLARDKQRVWVVSSGGAISVVAQQLMGFDNAQALKLNWHLVNAGVSKILASKDGLRLSSLNDHALFDKDNELVTYR
ncbi:histidine phosphatase family protein [Ferrimonas lipolytica]|uniref:Histidine phosphatase family protein n=1 Tax=Ferrimonas lipolytica TaxID=2724191 RepID=A0A6H1UIS6_9GAMM|nr:histidine phosphatase family protein [Ferrimonas lipolytica]QIZ78728.1 histidine phosphatase family protein [Ferrimonas lipolytica]